MSLSKFGKKSSKEKTSFGNKLVNFSSNGLTIIKLTIAKSITKNLSKFNTGRGFTFEEPTIAVNRRGGQPVAFVIQHNNFEKLTKALPKILDEARQSKILQNADIDLKFTTDSGEEVAIPIGISFFWPDA